MLGIQYHPPSHSSFSLEISGSLSSPQHMNTDWAFFTGPLMRGESEQTAGICFFLLLFFSGGEVGQYYTTILRHQEKQKSQFVVFLSVRGASRGSDHASRLVLVFLVASVFYKHKAIQNLNR